MMRLLLRVLVLIGVPYAVLVRRTSVQSYNTSTVALPYDNTSSSNLLGSHTQPHQISNCSIAASSDRPSGGLQIPDCTATVLVYRTRTTFCILQTPNIKRYNRPLHNMYNSFVPYLYGTVRVRRTVQVW